MEAFSVVKRRLAANGQVRVRTPSAPQSSGPRFCGSSLARRSESGADRACVSRDRRRPARWSELSARVARRLALRPAFESAGLRRDPRRTFHGRERRVHVPALGRCALERAHSCFERRRTTPGARRRRARARASLGLYTWQPWRRRNPSPDDLRDARGVAATRRPRITVAKSKESIAAPSRRFRNPELHRRRHELPRVVVSRRGAALGDESLPARRDDRRVDAPGGNTPRGGSRRRRGCHVDIPNSTGGQGLATSCPSSSSRCPASAHE